MSKFLAILATMAILLASATPALADGVKLIYAKALGTTECGAEWHWVITQVDGFPAPSRISVVWGSGTVEDVPLLNLTGKTAHYSDATHSSADTVVSASASIASAWDGQFNLSHRLCAPTATATPKPPTATPTATPTSTSTPGTTPTSTATPTATSTPRTPTGTPTTPTVTATPTSTSTPGTTPTPTHPPTTPTPAATQLPKTGEPAGEPSGIPGLAALGFGLLVLGLATRVRRA